MGQYWNLVCLDSHQAGGHMGKMSEAIIYADYPVLIERLLNTCKRPRIRVSSLRVKLPDSYKTKSFSPIEDLPTEILSRICLFLPTLDDMLCFALACYRFLEIGRRSAAMYADKGIASWAGKRIICAGDYIRDYPDGLLTEQDKIDMADLNLYEYAHGFECPLKLFDPHNHGKISTEYYRRAYCSVEKSPIGSRLLDELLPNNQPLYARENNYILLNMTTNEYVCASGIPDSHSNVFSLGHIVLLQTCWSSDYSMSIRHSVVDLHRGPWAGHCFKITSVEDIDSTSTDVSKSVIKKIAQVFDENRASSPVYIYIFE